jgi:hypothetical protein
MESVTARHLLPGVVKNYSGLADHHGEGEGQGDHVVE